ncbi:MAG: hypothetical protein Ct9H300mP7_5870 [Verrucomicrobiota bacterium]|nr:MAG: hypothetical protein Ct9H300mP7_5870 [Verrucomicrobiota bacterium]
MIDPFSVEQIADANLDRLECVQAIKICNRKVGNAVEQGPPVGRSRRQTSHSGARDRWSHRTRDPFHATDPNVSVL